MSFLGLFSTVSISSPPVTIVRCRRKREIHLKLQFRSTLNLQYFAIFALKSLLFCRFLQYSFGFHSAILWNLWISIKSLISIFVICILWTKYYAGCVFLRFRRQRWPVFVWLFYLYLLIYISEVCHFVTGICIVWFMLGGYLSIYQWNPCKSSDFFNIFSDFSSVYCEICEILIICILVSSSDLCIQVSGAGFRRKEGGIRILCICFLKQLVFICLFIHYIVHLSGILIRL